MHVIKLIIRANHYNQKIKILLQGMKITKITKSMKDSIKQESTDKILN